MNVGIPSTRFVENEDFRENVLNGIHIDNKFLDMDFIKNIFDETVFCGAFLLNTNSLFSEDNLQYILYNNSIEDTYMLGYYPICPIIKYSDSFVL